VHITTTFMSPHIHSTVLRLDDMISPLIIFPVTLITFRAHSVLTGSRIPARRADPAGRLQPPCDGKERWQSTQA
jgi:hypothetical protein